MSKRFDRYSWETTLNKIPNIPTGYDDCEVTVLVERKRTSRSKEQLAYYWAVVLPEIAHHTGHDVDDLHEIFKSKYLRKKRFWRGNDLTTVSSTTVLTLHEMSNFISLVIAEANEMEIEIPLSTGITG